MSPVTIGELNTAVTDEPSGSDAPAGPPPTSRWAELERLRWATAELAHLHDRTCSEGLSD